MKRLIAGLALSCLPVLAASGYGPRIYIHTDDEWGSYIAAAITKKNVPATVTTDKASADYVIDSTVKALPESTGSKIIRCLTLYCAGANGEQTASVQLIDAKTQEVVWGYNVHKGSAKAYQSTAEAIAKHLKQYLEQKR